MMITFLLFAVIAVAGAYEGLSPATITSYALRGAVLAYDVDVTKCDVHLMPATMPTYSFGDVMTYAVLTRLEDQSWQLTSALQRPVNASRFRIENGAWRVTELQFRGEGEADGTALMTLTDFEEGAQGKVLASGTLTCKMAQGAFVVNAQRLPGMELQTESDVMTALKTGRQLTFAVDLTGGCTLVQGSRSSSDSTVFSGQADGYRVPGDGGKGAVEFTAVSTTKDGREVLNVRLLNHNQVEVKAYSMKRPSPLPSPVTVFKCTMGTQGAFHVYQL